MRFLLLLSASALLAGCAQDVLDFRNAEISNNKVYDESSNEPFSGRVTNVPFSSIPKPNMGPLLQVAMKITGDDAIGNLLIASGMSALLGGGHSAILCDVEVEDGQLHGEARCAATNGYPVAEMTFTENVATEELKLFNPKKEGQLLAVASLESGDLSGESEVYGASGSVVSRMSWKQGKPEGTALTYDEETGNVIGREPFVGGRLNGEALQYAADGKTLIARRTYSNGFLNGPFEEYDPKTHALIKKTTFKGGVDIEKEARRDAELAQYQAMLDAANAEEDHEDDQVMYQRHKECVDRWSEAHRIEVGEEAIISNDQISEWTQWCEDGKETGAGAQMQQATEDVRSKEEGAENAAVEAALRAAKG